MTLHADQDERDNTQESHFQDDTGGPLPFKATSRLELRFLMPAGADLTCIGETHDGAGNPKPSDWIVDVPPGELERVANLLNRLANALLDIKHRRELEL